MLTAENLLEFYLIVECFVGYSLKVLNIAQDELKFLPPGNQFGIEWLPSCRHSLMRLIKLQEHVSRLFIIISSVVIMLRIHAGTQELSSRHFCLGFHRHYSRDDGTHPLSGGSSLAHTNVLHFPVVSLKLQRTPR